MGVGGGLVVAQYSYLLLLLLLLTLTNLPPLPLRQYVADAHRAGAKVKLYYTVRLVSIPMVSMPVVGIPMVRETKVKLYYAVRRSISSTT